MLMIMILLTLSLSPIFLFLSHPLAFGLILMILTLVVSLITGMMNFNFWFSYILFLIMVGGMLVLFIYMTSVASNEKFKFSYKILMLFIVMFILMTVIGFVVDLFLSSTFICNSELASKLTSNTMSMSKYINLPSNMIMFSVISYLLIALIMVVKITNIKYGPLRQKF